MKLRTLVYGGVIYPAYHFLKRDGINRAERIVRENESLTPEQLHALQEKKLRQLMEFATRHVPYYRDRFLEIGKSLDELLSPEGFRNWPVLTKEVLRLNKESLVATELRGNRLIPNSTSGSTGEATHFFTDTRSDAFRKAVTTRSTGWAGIENGEKTVWLWGAPIEIAKSKTFRARIRSRIRGGRLLSSFDLSEEKLREYAGFVADFRPALLVSYPGPLEVMAGYCRDHGITFDSLRAIITSAETLWPHQRALIESVFGVKVFNRYGSREFANIAHECPVSQGMHVNTDRVYIEVLDTEGRPCAPGESGELLITDLDNYGGPLIRYQIGDLGTWSPNPMCPCGRPFPLLESVEGRSLDIVVTPSGGRVGGTFWTLLLRSRPGMRRFQVVQESRSGIRIAYVPEDMPPEPDVLNYFEREIRKRCGQDFKVEFVEVARIDLGPSGKQRLVLSSVRKIPPN